MALFCSHTHEKSPDPSKLRERRESIIIIPIKGADPGERGIFLSSQYYTIRQEETSSLPQSQAKLLSISWAQYSEEWNSSLHTHNHAELFFVIGGQGSFQLQDRQFSVSSRDLVVINAGVPHAELSQSGSPMEYIVLGVDSLEVLASACGYVQSHFYTGWDEIASCLRLMLQEVRGGQPGHQYICQHLLEVILLRLLRRDDLVLTAPYADRRSSRECDLVRRYIDDHFKENLTLDQLAALAHINKYYLVHTFRKEYGISPISYQISRRIQESRMLLTSTDFNLSQIAQILGFSSLSYFSQSFRRLEGVSPMEYRKRNRPAAK